MKISFSLLLILGFISCQTPKEKSKTVLQHSFQLDKKGSFNLVLPDSDFLIGSIRSGFHTNSDNSLFAFEDHTMMQVIISDSTGRIITSIGEKGRGPKELLHITNAGFNANNEFVIFDARQFLFKVFDLNGDIVETFELESKKYFLASQNFVEFDSSYFFGIYEAQYLNNLKELPQSNIIAKIDGKGTDKRMFGNYDSLTPKSSLRNFNPSRLAFDKNRNIIFVTQSHSYIIQGWNASTFNRDLVINKKPPNFNFQNKVFDRNWSRKRIIEESVGFSSNSGVYLTDDYIILSFSTRRGISGFDYDHYIAIYNKTGEYLAEQKLPNSLVHVIDNKLYLRKDRNPANYTINIYELKKL